MNALTDILDTKRNTLFETRDKIAQAQREAAKKPDHPINDGLKAHFEERKRLLEALKNERK
ncbi:MAG: hypothetical protein RR966_08570 [Acinetobacter sp.]